MISCITIAFAEIPILFFQRAVVHRQSSVALYHPYLDSLAFTLIDIINTTTASTLVSVIVYFLTRLQRTASQFLYVSMQVPCFCTCTDA